MAQLQASSPVQANAPDSRVVSSVKDAAIGALIAFGLFAVIVGMRTDTAVGGLSLSGNWITVGWMVAVVFVGRLVLNLAFWKSSGGPKGVTSILPNFDKAGHVSKLLGPALLFVAIFLPFIVGLISPGQSRYYVDLGILVLTYVMLGWGLNIVVGLAGLLDLGYVAFYAVGAYSYALFAQYFDLGFWVCLPIAGILAAFWGIILGFPVLRLRGDYLAIVTLAFGEIIRIVLINWVDADRRAMRHLADPATDLLRPAVQARSDAASRRFFGLEFTPLHRTSSLLRDPHPGAADELP
jgi:branched-chain amino acid transport system permease protein